MCLILNVSGSRRLSYDRMEGPSRRVAVWDENGEAASSERRTRESGVVGARLLPEAVS